jgi:hypothetical protein
MDLPGMVSSRRKVESFDRTAMPATWIVSHYFGKFQLMQSGSKHDSGAAIGSPRPVRAHFRIAAEFADYFPAAEFSHYNAFLTACGDTHKRERRTVITVLKRSPGPASGREPAAFVLKVYRYPLIARIRTGLQISKAEREYDGLRHLRELGIEAAQAAGYGVERDVLGLVRSCFIITRWVENSITLFRWCKVFQHSGAGDGASIEGIFSEVGKSFSLMHRARLFLFTPKATNILIGQGHSVLIDVPYARTLRCQWLARWAQSRDVGVLLRDIRAALSDRAIESFFAGYLPDPLGGSAKTVRRRALRQMRAKRNQTPIARWVHGIKSRRAGKSQQRQGLYRS